MQTVLTEKKFLPADIYPDDIYLVSYPKSGNTWLRFLIGNLLSNNQCDFTNAHLIMPDIHYNPEQCALVPRPRFIKSHAPYVPEYTRVVYLVRDGRDVAVSYYYDSIKFGRIISGTPFEEFITMFHRGELDDYGIWGDHVNSWLGNRKQNLLLVRYEDMKRDTVRELSRIIEFTGMALSEEQLKSAITASQFSRMQKLEKAQEDQFEQFLNSNRSIPFIRSGRVGESEEYFTPELSKEFNRIHGDALSRLGYLEISTPTKKKKESVDSSQDNKTDNSYIVLNSPNDIPDGEIVPKMEIRLTNDKQIDAFEDAYQKIRSPKTKFSIRDPNHFTKHRLKQLGFIVEEYQIDMVNFQNYLKAVQYEETYPDFYPGNLPEKALEHYLAAKLLQLNPSDTYVNVMTGGSPAPKIYSDLFGVKSLTHEMSVDPYFLEGEKRLGGSPASLPLPDDSVDKLALHCGLEHLEGDEDIQFIKSLSKVLKPGGKACIIPLYLSNNYGVITDPEISVREGTTFEDGVMVYCMRGWNNRFGRIYDPEHLFERILKNIDDLRLKIIHIDNAKQIDPTCYVEYAMLLEKNGDNVTKTIAQEYITSTDNFEAAYQRIRDPKTKISPQAASQWIVQDLNRYGFDVKNFTIDIDDYRRYYNEAHYSKEYPGYYAFNIHEKSLEHYIAARLLKLNNDEIYIDIASQQSPTPKIYSKLFGITAYRQDMDYPKGLNGDTIGGDAADMPVPDGFANKIALHCSLEHFEGDADSRLIHEIERVLKPGGAACIVPLYLSSQYHIITDPVIAVSQNVQFEKDVLLFCKRGWNNRHGRQYDPASLYSRIKKHLGSLRMKIFRITNAKEVDSSCYVEFAMLLEKDGKEVKTSSTEEYIKLADEKAAAGDLDGAIDLLFECSGLYPDVVEVYQLLAILMVQKQTFQSARVMLEKAITLKQDDAQLYNQLGTVCYLSGDNTASKAAYEKALSIDPNMDDVKANLAELSRILPVKKENTPMENELNSLLDQLNKHIAVSRALTDNLVSIAERVEKLLGRPDKPAMSQHLESAMGNVVKFGKGFHQDEGGFRWVAAEGQIVLSSLSQFDSIEIDFNLTCANANCYSQFPFETRVFVGNEEKACLVFDADEQTRSVKIKMPTDKQDNTIIIVSSQSFIPAQLGGGSPDMRELSVQFSHLNIMAVPKETQVNETIKVKLTVAQQEQERNQEEVNWWKHFIFKHFSPDQETSQKLFLDRFRIECTKRWNYICDPLGFDTNKYRESALLDIGNGPCGLLNFVPGIIKVGIDPNNQMYRANEILFNIEDSVRYITCPAEKLPLPDAFFDFISCVNVLDHVNDPQIVLDEIIRVLKPGGVFFLSVDTRREEETSLVHPHAFDGGKFIEMAKPLVCLHSRNDQPCYDDNPVNKRFDGWFQKI